MTRKSRNFSVKYTKVETVGRIWANFRRVWNLISSFFFVDSSSAYIVLKHSNDNISIYPRWRLIIREKMCDMEINLRPIFFLKLLTMKLESS